MPVDFSATVLSAGMSTFAIPVTIDPIASQPGEMPYPARGVFTDQARDLVLDDGAVLSTQDVKIGIRAADMLEDGSPMWRVLPARGDRCTFKTDGSGRPLPEARLMWVSEVGEDGQGGYVLNLRRDIPD